MIKYIYILLIFINTPIFGQINKQYDLINVINNIDEESVDFYNLIKTDKNELIVGSSKGVLKWHNNSFDLVDQFTVGNVKIDLKTKSGYKFSNASIEEINRTSEFNYLLPQKFSENIFSSQIVGTNLYMVVENKLYHFINPEYIKKFEGKSVRVISENFIGTYNGIFKNNTLDPKAPNYTNSYIREFGDEVIINFDGIYRENPNGHQYFRSFDGRFKIDSIDMGYALDTQKVDDKYFVLTTNGLWLTNFKGELIDIFKFNEINRSEVYQTPKYIDFIEASSQEPKRILYYLNQSITILDIENLTFAKVIDIPNGAIDIKRFENQTYWIDRDNINLLDSNNKIQPIYPNNFDFHTLYPLNETYLALSSDGGLYRLNLETKEIIKLFSSECNRLALNVLNDTLNIGLVDGLIKYPVNEFISYTPQVSSSLIEAEIVVILFLFAIIFVLSYNLMVKKNKVVPLELEKNNLADDITNFILENLVGTDVNSIKEKFNISYRQLAKIYHPIGPGKMIENIRKQEAEKMILNGESLPSISKKTGYSLSYLKKIINPPSK